jgi:TonB family protein
VELLGDAIFLKGVQLILIILAGLIFLVIGYKLFHYGIDKGRSKLRNQSETYKIIFSGSGPGLFFMVFGGLVLLFAIISIGIQTKDDILKTVGYPLTEQRLEPSNINIGIEDSAGVKDMISAAVIPVIPNQSSLSSRRPENKSQSERKIKRTLKTADLRGAGLKSSHRSQAELSRVINKHNNAIEYCYRKEVKLHPDLKGDLDVEFTVDYMGRVTAVRIVRSSMYNKKIEKCISGRIRGWRFKPIAQGNGDVKVRQKYIFG